MTNQPAVPGRRDVLRSSQAESQVTFKSDATSERSENWVPSVRVLTQADVAGEAGWASGAQPGGVVAKVAQRFSELLFASSVEEVKRQGVSGFRDGVGEVEPTLRALGAQAVQDLLVRTLGLRPSRPTKVISNLVVRGYARRYVSRVLRHSLVSGS